MVGMDEGHEKGSLALEYVFWNSFREGNEFFIIQGASHSGGGIPADFFLVSRPRDFA